MSPSFRRPWCMDRSYTTDLKVRGYLITRLPDEFPNSDTNIFVRGCEKDTKSNLSNRIFFVWFLDKRFKKCNLLNKGMRLKDAMPHGRIAAGS